MKLLRRLSIPFLFFAILLSACGGAPATEAPRLDFILTEGVKTMVASYFETQTAIAPPPTATASITPTLMPSPAFTPSGFLNNAPTLTATFLYYPTLARTSTVTGTPPTATLPAGGFGCNNLALLYDIYPNGSNVVKPGESFIMTWKVHNSGTCDWKAYYRLTQVSGTNFDAPAINLGRIYPPGKNPEISLQMDAPNRTGTFTAQYRMDDGSGHLFGSTLVVTIKVQEEAPPATSTTAPAPSLTPSITEAPTLTPTP